MQLAGHGDGLSGKGLVGLHQVHVLDGQAGLLQSLTGSGHGAHAHDLGIHAALAPADELGHGLQTVLLHSLAGGQHDGGSAVVDAGGVGGGDTLGALVGSILCAGDLKGVYHLRIGGLGTHGERTLQLGDAVGGDAFLHVLVALELHDLLLHLHGDGHDLIVEAAGIPGGAGLLLGGGGELVLLAAGNAPDVVDILGGGAHVIVVIGVPQTVLDHGVHQLLVAHTSAPAGVHGGIGSGAHVLGAAADHDVGITGQDGACALDDGLHAGAADHADGIGRHGVGDTGLNGNLTRHILALCRSQDAAEHQLIHVLGSNVGTLQGLLDHDRAHLGGRSVLQGAAKGTDSGSAAVDNIQVFHEKLPPIKIKLIIQHRITDVYGYDSQLFNNSQPPNATLLKNRQKVHLSPCPFRHFDGRMAHC